MPNPGLPMRYFKRPHVDSPQKPRFEQKIPGRSKIRWIFYYLPYLDNL